MKKWARIGDTIEMTSKYRNWLIQYIPTGYVRPGGEYDHQFDSELVTLFTSKYFDLPLRGKVTKLGCGYREDGCVTGHICNLYGTYSGYLDYSHYKILKRAKKRKPKK